VHHLFIRCVQPVSSIHLISTRKELRWGKLRVAPTGERNEYIYGFGERSANMNLQIIGDKAVGVLQIIVDFNGRTGKPRIELPGNSWDIVHGTQME